MCLQTERVAKKTTYKQNWKQIKIIKCEAKKQQQVVYSSVWAYQKKLTQKKKKKKRPNEAE